jgi:hypothetical protein
MRISSRRPRQDEIPEIILWLGVVDNVLHIHLQMDAAGVTTPLFKVHEKNTLGNLGIALQFCRIPLLLLNI